MTAATLAALLGSGQLSTLRRATTLTDASSRLAFLAAAAHEGVIARLATGPLSAPDLARHLGLPDPDDAAFAAWLDAGVALGQLRRVGSTYALHGLAATFADPRHDALLAIVEEVATLHQRLLLETPDRLRRGERFTLADQDGGLIARSSRVLEPFVREAVCAVVPTKGAFRLLEVGCGSGVYLRLAADRNAELHALGLELQPAVAEVARENLRAWGVGERVTVEAGDVRARTPTPDWDLVTLHNNIYYFPPGERVALLQHLRGFLVPSGRILLTTVGPGGSVPGAVIDLWGAATEGCGRLPTSEELCAQLRAAGFVDVEARNLAAPLDRFWAFTARRA